MTLHPTDDEIEGALLKAPVEHWNELWTAVAALEAKADHVRWSGGDQVDTTVVDGVEQKVVQMPYAVYSSAVHHVVQALYDLDAIVSFDWSERDGVKRYRAVAGLTRHRSLTRCASQPRLSAPTPSWTAHWVWRSTMAPSLPPSVGCASGTRT